jgi:2,3-diketo-5-methylthiopentyl-1-phosphate enolase
MNLSSQVHANAEQIAEGEYLLATYYTEAPADEDIYARAAALAVGQSIGTWTPVPGITANLLAENMARVVSVYDVPPTELATDVKSDRRAFVLQLAFPNSNLGSSFPLILTTLLGNDVSTSIQLKLIDIQVSSSLAASLGGPRFGIQGIRQLTGVKGRPLLLNVLKPCTGFPPEAAVPWFRESALGGTDVIKDDELLGNPSFNQVLQRVTLMQKTAEQVFQETGHRTLYCVNVTDRADVALDNARKAVELGVDMIMINAIFSGLGLLQSLAADQSVNVPILAHFAGFATMTEAQSSGISSPLLLGKLLRLAGADAVSITSPYSAYPLLREKFVRTAQLMSLPLYEIKAALPVPGGGVHPSTAWRLVHDLGPDIMLSVGGAIQGHPNGAAAGARAMIAALEAAADGIPLDTKAHQVPELKIAIDRWGT